MGPPPGARTGARRSADPVGPQDKLQAEAAERQKWVSVLAGVLQHAPERAARTGNLHGGPHERRLLASVVALEKAVAGAKTMTSTSAM